MNYENLIQGVNLAIQDRYSVDTDSCSLMLSLCPPELSDHAIFRLERIAEPKLLTRKTILISSIEDDSQTIHALRWAALAKEILTDPESSDLYLFIYFKQTTQLEVCLRIESTEQFCRKYVMHPEETVENFLGRTFLAKPTSSSQGSLSADPLLKSFVSVGLENNWFTPEEQSKWKQILLSGSTGSDLIEELFNLNKGGNEVPEENND